MLLLTILLQHASIEACLGELRRNRSLRTLIGIESESKVPKKWNLSRFLDVLGTDRHLSLLHEVFDTMIQQLGEVVVDLGAHTAGDASGLNARCENQKKAARSGLPIPAGGRKEYTDESGRVVKIVEWIGYKFHLLVDVKHEVVLAYQISSTKKGDNEVLPRLVDQARANLSGNSLELIPDLEIGNERLQIRIRHGRYLLTQVVGECTGRSNSQRPWIAVAGRRSQRIERGQKTSGEVLLFQAQLGVGGIVRAERLQRLVGRG